MVRGDIVLFGAGKNIPGDCLVLESKYLSVDEAVLTGETYQVDKLSGLLQAVTGLNQLANSLYMGTNVINSLSLFLYLNQSVELTSI